MHRKVNHICDFTCDKCIFAAFAAQFKAATNFKLKRPDMGYPVHQRLISAINANSDVMY